MGEVVAMALGIKSYHGLLSYTKNPLQRVTHTQICNQFRTDPQSIVQQKAECSSFRLLELQQCALKHCLYLVSLPKWEYRTYEFGSMNRFDSSVQLQFKADCGVVVLKFEIFMMFGGEVVE